ncbi:uncharacterized protein LOC111658255 [Seriola lalandi dorsalis]|uniref:uncharacterized protein LOC111658255 n=1 Tax=Seriola lalandi dorsalis TaxID=1841481 RepID=UPI000C6FAE48|nr:uncharacterized protein LOC111658255 [Seriola lalandi dorsalis]
MDIMFKASSLLLLLLTLSLNVQLYSSGPIPATVVQSSVIAEEPGPGPAEEAPIPVIPVETSEDGPQEENANEETTVVEESAGENASSEQDDVPDPDPAAAIPIIPVGAAEDEENTEEAAPEDTLPIVPDDQAEVEPGASQEPLSSAPEEEKSVFLIPPEPETEDLVQEEPVGFFIEYPEEDTAFSIILGDPTTNEEPEEPETYEDAAAEDTAPAELLPESPVVIVPIPIVSEENDEEDPGTNEEHLPSTPEEEESFVNVQAELETEEEGQEETAPQEVALGEPVVVLVDPTSKEPAPEDPILLIHLEDLEQEAPEDDIEEEEEDKEVVQSDPLAEEPEEILPEILVIAVTETPSESEATEIVLDPVEEVPVAATETVTEAPVEPVTAPAPTVTDAEAERAPAPEGGNGTSMTTHTEDFTAAVTLTAKEPAAQVNRGAELEAGFFTLTFFITIGFL